LPKPKKDVDKRVEDIDGEEWAEESLLKDAHEKPIKKKNRTSSKSENATKTKQNSEKKDKKVISKRKAGYGAKKGEQVFDEGESVAAYNVKYLFIYIIYSDSQKVNYRFTTITWNLTNSPPRTTPSGSSSSK